jgi:TonB family protein
MGIAYDSLVRGEIGATASPSIPQSSFDDDYRTASQGRPSQTLSTGIAIRAYLTPSKERTDYLNVQRATIIDCAAKIVTTLDLSAKTYSVHNFDRPYPSTQATSLFASTFKDSKRTVAIATVALGPKTVKGVSADGYAVETSTTTTLASGRVMSSKTNLTAYYTETRVPQLECPKARALAIADGLPFGRTTLLDPTVRNALQGANTNTTTVRQGPRAPTDRVPIFEAYSMRLSTPSGTPTSSTVLMEFGHVRVIASDDPVFSIPADFKVADPRAVSTNPPSPASQTSTRCATPHVDAAMTQAVPPVYPASARQQGATGTVLVKVTLDSTGAVVGTWVYRSSGNDALDDAALQAAQAGSYRPEINDCRPMGGSYIFHADFKKP